MNENTHSDEHDEGAERARCPIPLVIAIGGNQLQLAPVVPMGRNRPRPASGPFHAEPPEGGR